MNHSYVPAFKHLPQKASFGQRPCPSAEPSWLEATTTGSASCAARPSHAAPSYQTDPVPGSRPIVVGFTRRYAFAFGADVGMKPYPAYGSGWSAKHCFALVFTPALIFCCGSGSTASLSMNRKSLLPPGLLRAAVRRDSPVHSRGISSCSGESIVCPCLLGTTAARLAAQRANQPIAS